MSHRALLSPPDPQAVLRTVELPLALVGALLAHPILLFVDDAVRQTRGVRGGWAAVALCTALVSVLHFRVTTGARTPGGVFARCAVLGIAFGPLNSGLSLAAVTTLHEGLGPNVFAAFVMGAVFGCVAGGCIGLLYGLAYSPLAMAASRHREHPTHAGAEKARATVGAMLLVASGVHYAAVAGTPDFEIFGAIVGAWLLGVSAWRLIDLERFLRAVQKGAEPTWSLAEARDPSDAAGLSPIHGGHGPEKILYRATADDRATPYRAQSQWLPVARLAR